MWRNSAVFWQDYSAKPVIEGVRIEDRRRGVDEAGSFSELCRTKELTDQGFDLQQVNISTLVPGAIKAFHLHGSQTDVWHVPPSDRMMVLLFDVREDSPTQDVSMRVTLGAGTNRCLWIPPGVAHGCRNTGNHDATLIYLVDRVFNPDHGEEARLPWDYFGAQHWELVKE